MSGGGSGAAVGVSSNHGGAHTRKMKSRNAGVGSGGLMLTSMLDILTTILFFLMQNFSQVKADFQIGKDISLPYSSAIQNPVPALQLVITKNAILLDNVQIAEIVNGDVKRTDLFRDNVTILPLAQELKKQKERSQVQNAGGKESWVGSIVMQADKDLQFALLKKVIYTAGISDFVMFKLAVLKKEA